jgi:hypothetical protein
MDVALAAAHLVFGLYHLKLVAPQNDEFVRIRSLMFRGPNWHFEENGITVDSVGRAALLVVRLDAIIGAI